MSRLILFDFDGTLVDSRPALAELLYAYSETANLPKPDVMAFQKGYVDTSLCDFGWGLDAKGQELHKNKFFDWASDKRDAAVMPLPYDGIISLLEKTFKKQTLGIVTSRGSDSTNFILRGNNMSHYFKDMRTRCDQKNRGHGDKPSPDKVNCIINELGFDKKDVVMIGDTCADVGAATNAGIKSIAVTWGYQDRPHLETQNPTMIIDQVSDLNNAIEDIFSA